MADMRVRTREFENAAYSVLFAMVHDSELGPVLAFLALLVEDIQLLSFSWSRQFGFTPLPGLFAFEYKGTNENYGAFQAIFGVAFAVVLVVILTCLYIGISYRIGRFRAVWPVRLLRLLSTLLSTLLLMPITTVFLQAVNCKKNSVSGEVELVDYPGTACFSGKHAPVFALSLVSLVFMITYALTMALICFEQDPRSKNPSARPHGRAEAVYVFVRVFLLAVYEFAGHESRSASGAKLGVALPSLLFLCYVVLYYQPFYVSRMTDIRAGIFFASAGGVIIAIGIFASNGGSGTAAFAVLCVLTPAFFVGGYFASGFVRRRIIDGVYNRLAIAPPIRMLSRQGTGFNIRDMAGYAAAGDEPEMKGRWTRDAIRKVAMRKVKKDPPVFDRVTDVEIAARFLRENREADAILLAHDLFATALQEFPRSALLRIVHARYIANYSGQATAARKQLEAAMSMRPPFDIRCLIFMEQRSLDQEKHTEGLGIDDNLNITSYIQFQMAQTGARRHHIEALRLSRSFWHTASSSTVDAPLLFDTAHQLSLSTAKARNHYERLLSEYPKSKTNLRLYSQFLRVVCNNADLAAEYANAADDIEEEEMRLSTARARSLQQRRESKRSSSAGLMGAMVTDGDDEDRNSSGSKEMGSGESGHNDIRMHILEHGPRHHMFEHGTLYEENEEEAHEEEDEEAGGLPGVAYYGGSNDRMDTGSISSGRMGSRDMDDSGDEVKVVVTDVDGVAQNMPPLIEMSAAPLTKKQSRRGSVSFGINDAAGVPTAASAATTDPAIAEKRMESRSASREELRLRLGGCISQARPLDVIGGEQKIDRILSARRPSLGGLSAIKPSQPEGDNKWGSRSTASSSVTSREQNTQRLRRQRVEQRLKKPAVNERIKGTLCSLALLALIVAGYIVSLQVADSGTERLQDLKTATRPRRSAAQLTLNTRDLLRAVAIRSESTYNKTLATIVKEVDRFDTEIMGYMVAKGLSIPRIRTQSVSNPTAPKVAEKVTAMHASMLMLMHLRALSGIPYTVAITDPVGMLFRPEVRYLLDNGLGIALGTSAETDDGETQYERESSSQNSQMYGLLAAFLAVDIGIFFLVFIPLMRKMTSRRAKIAALFKLVPRASVTEKVATLDEELECLVALIPEEADKIGLAIPADATESAEAMTARNEQVAIMNAGNTGGDKSNSSAALNIESAHIERSSPWKLWMRFAVGIIVVGAFAIGMYITPIQQNEKNNNMARLINLSNSRRYISQGIAALANELVAADNSTWLPGETITVLNEWVSALESAHTMCVDGTSRTTSTNKVSSLYNELIAGGTCHLATVGGCDTRLYNPSIGLTSALVKVGMNRMIEYYINRAKSYSQQATPYAYSDGDRIVLNELNTDIKDGLATVDATIISDVTEQNVRLKKNIGLLFGLTVAAIVGFFVACIWFATRRFEAEIVQIVRLFFDMPLPLLLSVAQLRRFLESGGDLTAK